MKNDTAHTSETQGIAPLARGELIQRITDGGFACGFWALYDAASCKVSPYTWSVLRMREHDRLPLCTLETLTDDQLREISDIDHGCYVIHSWRSGKSYGLPHKLRTSLDEAAGKAIQAILVEYLKPIEELSRRHGGVSLPLGNTEAQSLGTRILNAINRRGIMDLVELTEMTRTEFMSPRGVGEGMATQVADLLAEHQLQFASE